MIEDGAFADRELSREFERLREAVPAVVEHRQALKLLGADFRYIRKYVDGSWMALVDPGEGLAGRFGLNRDVMLIYSLVHELQPAVLSTAEKRRTLLPQNLSCEDHVVLISSIDPRSPQKLHAWAQSDPMLGIHFSIEGTPDHIARSLLAELQRKLASRNLYDETLPVTGADFFGRRKELTQLQEELRQGKVCGVFGLRKTGKTSLVKELGRRFVSGRSDRIFVLRDLESLPQRSERLKVELVQEISQGLLAAFRAAGVRRAELAELELDASIGEFKRALAVSLNDCETRGVQVVLALDEIESLLGDAETLKEGSRPEVPEFLGALRSLVQEHSIFNVVVSGITSAAIHRGELFGVENPLFNWARSYHIQPMSKVEVDRLTTDVGKRMGVEWSSDSLDKMYEIAIGDVFLHRTLAAAVVEGLGQDMFPIRVTDENVQAVQRNWRRGVAERLAQMFGSFERHYPTEASLLRLAAAGDADWGSLEDEYSIEVGRLLDLGLVTEGADGEIEFGALCQTLATARVL
ncbi:ATP-binding protein [Nocardioides sp. NPDC006273]|uniref:ATP-binding protein n=1 Tax=Nocardioides sp. NPDC006273 TaxID=3155598 RepID=UPI0033A82E74